jgi:hypothetical protein
VKRAALFLLLAAMVLPLVGADCDMGKGAFTFRVLGPEAHDNLWQFATVRGWNPASSATVYDGGGHSHGRLSYAEGYFGLADSPCNYGLVKPDGSTLCIACEYVSGANTSVQRAYFAVRSHVTADPAPTIADVTMREVPHVTAVNDAGSVTVAWTEPPSQSEVVGYRVVRSADGLATWATVIDKPTGQTSAIDNPGSGTWYYALQIIYANDGTNKVVSPHGLAASVVVP